MNRHRTYNIGVGSILFVSLGCLVVFTAFPLYWMTAVSLMPAGSVNTLPLPLIPDSITLEHYLELFGRHGMGRYLLNSMLLASVVTLFSVVVNSMAGYAFAKFRFSGRKPLLKILFASLIIPVQVTLIPLFLLLKNLGLVNTFAGVIIPGILSIFGILLIQQYTQSIPDSLLEAARIDGASEFRIYVAIVVPLIKPILVTLAIFVFMGTWNDFLWPLIVFSDDDLYTLPVALASLSMEHEQSVELLMAGSVITVLPILILFLFLQKYYVQGIITSGMKK